MTLRPDTTTIEAAKAHVLTASAAQTQGRYCAAVDAYRAASATLRSEIERLRMVGRMEGMLFDAAEMAHLVAYADSLDLQCTQLEPHAALEAHAAREKRQHQQAVAASAASTATRMASSTTPPPPGASRPSPASFAAPTGKPLSASAPAGRVPAQGGALAGGPPPLPAGFTSFALPMERTAVAGGGASHWLPRASDIVLRAVDAATKLTHSKQFKRAADMLQHAYDVGMREDHRPSNLASIPDLIRSLRVKYIAHVGARPVQDNVPSADEMELLSRSGRTKRLLLGQWDSTEEGYPAENVFMPVMPPAKKRAAAGAAAKDELVPVGEGWVDAVPPQFTNTMVKQRAVWRRMPEVAQLWAQAGGQMLSPVPGIATLPASPDGEAGGEEVVGAQTLQLPAQPPVLISADQQPLAEVLSPTDSAVANGGTSVSSGAADGVAGASSLASPAVAVPPVRPTVCVIRGATPDPHSIRQTSVSDCSLVCSLIITAAYERRFPGARLIRSAIYPQDENTREPCVNPFGKYCIKMLLNGTTRCVPVDDRVPVAFVPQPSATAVRTTQMPPRILCSQSVDMGEMWVALVEKAFIKVCGGTYDFSGSNSATDLYRLCGWLPDIVPFPLDRSVLATTEEDDETDASAGGFGSPSAHSTRGGESKITLSSQRPFDAALQWTRLVRNLERGACVATMSTPEELAPSVVEHLALFPGHAYAILDAKELATHQRLIKMKNPWAKQTWRGLFSIEDRGRATPEMLSALGFSEQEAKEGIFWMSWQDCVKFFQCVHLSWNPFLLFAQPTPGAAYVRPTRIARHDIHRAVGFGFASFPQFQIFVPCSAATAFDTAGTSRRMHIVFSRHILDDAEEYGGSGKMVEARREAKARTRFVAVHIFDVTNAPSAAAASALTPDGSDYGSLDGAHGLRLVAAESFAVRRGRCRRLAGDHDLPKSACIHRGTYTNSANFTASFSCPGPGPRELVAVVARLDTRETRGSTQNLCVEPADMNVEPFPFSLTLYTGLPAASGVDLVNIRRADGTGPGLGLRAVASVKGEWLKGRSCGGPPHGQTFLFNPQYSFTLTRPSHVRATITTPLNAPVNVVVCRVAPPAGGGKGPLWMLRADRTGRYSVVMRAPCSAPYAATVDTVLASNMAREPQWSTGVRSDDGQAVSPQAGRLAFRVVDGGSNSPPILRVIDLPACACRLLRAMLGAQPAMTAGALVVTAALASKDFAAPGISRFVVAGAEVPLNDPAPPFLLAAIFTPSLAQEPPVLVLNSAALDRQHPTLAPLATAVSESAESAIQLLRNVSLPVPGGGTGGGGDVSGVEAALKEIATLDEAVLRVTTLLDGVEGVSEGVKKTRRCLVQGAQCVHNLLDRMRDAIAATAAAAASSSGSGTVGGPGGGSGPSLLRASGETRLPPGRYVAVPMVHEKGVPGRFCLTLEADEAAAVSGRFDLVELPPEGTDWRACPAVIGGWVSQHHGSRLPQGLGTPASDAVSWRRYATNPTVRIVVSRVDPALHVFIRILLLPPPGLDSSLPPSAEPDVQGILFFGDVAPQNAVAHSGLFCSHGISLRAPTASANAGQHFQCDDDDDRIANAVGVPLPRAGTYLLVLAPYEGAIGWRFACNVSASSAGVSAALTA